MSWSVKFSLNAARALVLGAAGAALLGPGAFAMSHIPGFGGKSAEAGEGGGVSVTFHLISPDGIGEEIGNAVLSDSDDGLVVTPDLSSLPPGAHGFHVHTNGACGPAEKDGVMVAGLAAGGHFDPDGTGKHEGPEGSGHLGDLPVLTVGEDGHAGTALTVPRLSLEQVRGHALIIHAGGDNYSDDPSPLGGGGARIACGVVGG